MCFKIGSVCLGELVGGRELLFECGLEGDRGGWWDRVVCWLLSLDML